jgi:predicted phage-related endonuclease
MTDQPTNGRPATGLTKAQLEARSKGIGGSDAERIMAGETLALWEEKTGRRPPEDLTWDLPVQIGNATEPLNARWFEHETGLVVDRSPAIKGSTLYHPAYKFMLCHPDGLVAEGGLVKLWEAKHTTPFEAADAILARSFAQLQHNMECGDYPEAFLSVIYGNLKWAYFRIKRDPDYIGELLDREEAFWRCVETDTPPDGTEPAEAPVVEAVKVVDLSSNNMWPEMAAIWVENRDAAKAFKEAEAGLKALVDPDVAFAYGTASVKVTKGKKVDFRDVTLAITRHKDGKLALREPTKKDAERIATHQATKKEEAA